MQRRHTPEQINRELAERHKLITDGTMPEEVCHENCTRQRVTESAVNQVGG